MRSPYFPFLHCRIIVLVLSWLVLIAINFRVNAQNINSWKVKQGMGFIKNEGQISDQQGYLRPDVKYIYSAPGLKVIFKSNSFSYEVYTIEKAPKPVSEAAGKQVIPYTLPAKFQKQEEKTIKAHRIDIMLNGAASNPEIQTGDKSDFYQNYYLAHLPEQGLQKVYSYGKLTYKNVWPKIDIVFYAKKEGELKYDIVLQPGAKISDIQFTYKGLQGIELKNEELRLQTSLGKISEAIPLSYIKEDKIKVAISYSLKGNTVKLNGCYNRRKTLVIDPVLKWATYFGTSFNEDIKGVSCDTLGNIFVTGHTESHTGIATNGAYQTSSGGTTDIFIAKFDSLGKRIWSTYCGGTGSDQGFDIVCDSASNIYVTGQTNSTNGIATAPAHQPNIGGLNNDAFLISFNSDGKRNWGTYYGGSQYEEGFGVTCDRFGNIFITGATNSSTAIATPGAHQQTRGNTNIYSSAAFLAKFDNAGKRLWGTYYNGNQSENSFDVGCDLDGNVYICGLTFSTNGITTAGVHQEKIHDNVSEDAMLVKFDSNGKRLWGTYFGGNNQEWALAIACDAYGAVYITGFTQSTNNIATGSAHQVKYGNSYDAFLAKFTDYGKLSWATYYGGSGSDNGYGISCDNFGSVYLTGITSSTTNIATGDGYQTANGGNADIFIAKFNSKGTRKWASYYGGSGYESSKYLGNDISTDRNGNIYVISYTTSHDKIATLNSHQPTYAGGQETFIARFYDPEKCPVSLFSSTQTNGCPNTEIVFQNKSMNAVKQTWYFGDGDTASIFQPMHIYKSAGKYPVSLVSYSASGCKDSITLPDYIHILPFPEAIFSSDIGQYNCDRITFTYNNISTSADSFHWSFGDSTPIQTTNATGSLKHTYYKSGEYKTTLIAYNGYCTDTAVIIQQVTIRKSPEADFTIENAKLCIGNATTKFHNQSIFGDSYIWDFGDGTVDTNKNPAHTFTSPGKYNITLVVKSKEGCTHTKIWNDAISVSAGLNAEFTADRTLGCAPLTVNFHYTKPDTGLLHHWDFDNGKTSTQANPTMIFEYGQKDSFYVKLLVNNKICTDSSGQWIKIMNLREDKDTANIILATVEDNKHVRLYWNRLNVANRYLLHRSENGTDFNFKKYLTDTTFSDELADVHNQSYYYKITGIDACGGTTAQSKTVRTILLKATVTGQDESAALSWNHYEGFGNHAAHNILRDNNFIYTTSAENAFTDVIFFDENLLQRCYKAEAINTTGKLQSLSNEVCLPYKTRIYIPNAFSPNYDAINEAFQPKTTGIKSYDIKIYNRWGELVFSGNQKQAGWDGKFRNTPVADGVYFYIFSGKDMNGKGFYKNGTITLLR